MINNKVICTSECERLAGLHQKMEQSWLKLACMYVTMTDHGWQSFDVLATQTQEWLSICEMSYQTMNNTVKLKNKAVHNLPLIMW